jgi:hypothetical protein
MAPQNFNSWSLTFDHVHFDDSQVAITINNYDSRVSNSSADKNYLISTVAF